ncbi:AAA family ATPase [Kosakonia sp. WA-90]|uniref:AAA family ATPase n=1 Tax=Kosakonia sp. WA-90 TaxID=3153576 RepID=UPI00325DD3B2
MKVYFCNSLAIDGPEGLYLVPDNIVTNHSAQWNDFGFEMMFAVHYHSRRQETEYIGMARFLCRSRMNTASYFTEHGEIVRSGLYDISRFMRIDNIISLGNEIDYYKMLNFLRMEYRLEPLVLLNNLCDASYYALFHSETGFKTWNGYKNAFLRNKTTAETLLTKGVSIAAPGAIELAHQDLTIEELDLPETFEPVKFSFSRRRSGELTDNINIIIGKNGLGKTLVLKEIINSIAGISLDKTNNGKFLKLIVAAFSPFENFPHREEILDEIEKLEPIQIRSSEEEARRIKMLDAYTYIGFRNPQRVFDTEWPKAQSVIALQKILEHEKVSAKLKETSRFTLLTQTLRRALSFDHIALTDKNGFQIIVDPNDDIDFDAINLKAGLSFIRNGDEKAMSSGQLMYAYMIPPLIAHIEDESLVLIDEPELYLHPELEIGLIKMLKTLLRETRSYAVIATHSALMVREIHKNRVTILQEGNASQHSTRVMQPQSETFAASIEQIIGEAFNDYFSSKPFEEEIDAQIRKYDSAEEAIRILFPKLGSDGQQYLFSKLDNSHYTLGDRDESTEPYADPE